MARIDYEVIVAGGGLGGSTLARALARRGARVLIVEREEQFKDRVRGEGMLPWGVAEARALGIYELLRNAGAWEVRWWTRYFGSTLRERRDLVATTPARTGCLDFYHPAMQSGLLEAAEASGVGVRRGTAIVGVIPGNPPAVRILGGRHEEQLYARLVIGADGRNSKVRASAGFVVHRDPRRLVVAGVLHEGLQIPEDAVQYISRPSIGQGALVFPIGQRRFRSYFVHRTQGAIRPLSGRRHIGDFVAACVDTGVPAAWYEGAEVAGPLAAFDGADAWVDRPYRDGIVLVGDAAAASDPTWGCGLSLTLRDVRVLRDQLLTTTDWPAAADAYATEHDGYYSALHRLEDWLTVLMYEMGPDADARRARVLPRFAEDPSRAPDFPGLGPDSPSDEAARRRFFAEDLCD
jgi:2-polyprenyl-6-methoxyphenol hydroxylase-like FAD-dependent oxidoreductase